VLDMWASGGRRGRFGSIIFAHVHRTSVLYGALGVRLRICRTAHLTVAGSRINGMSLRMASIFEGSLEPSAEAACGV